MRGPTKYPSKWTFDAIVSHVKENDYTAKRDWCKQSPGSYQTARNNGWVDAVCLECGLDTEHKRKWQNVQQVIDVVKQRGYKTLIEWGDGDGQSYSAALTHDWLEAVMVECGIERQHTDWESVDQVIAIVKERCFKTKVEWIKGHNKSYATSRLKGWLQQVFDACGLENTNRTFATIDDVIAVVQSKGYASKADWFYADVGSYMAARGHGWMPEVCAACGIPLVSPSFRPDRPHQIYVVLLTTIDGVFLGYGNTAVLKNRMKQHRTSAKKVGASVELLEAYEFPDWHASTKVEQSLKDTFPKVDTLVSGFRTEATYLHNLSMVKAFIATAPDSLICTIDI